MAHYEVMPNVIAHCTDGLDHFGPHGRLVIVSPGIARPSAASLYLDLVKNGAKIGYATGFVVTHDETDYLITNEHVVLGKGQLPDHLVIVHNRASALGTYEMRDEPLYDADGKPLWYEHVDKSLKVDVVALPLTAVNGVDLLVHDPWAQPAGLRVGPGEALNVIGFPFGLTGGANLGVWVRGFVASEPELDWNNQPCFLIDARTREGQSGSPVIAYNAAGPTPMASGDLNIRSQPTEEFVGVYSGRIVSAESDLGVVWKARTIREIIAAKKRAA